MFRYDVCTLVQCAARNVAFHQGLPSLVVWTTTLQQNGWRQRTQAQAAQPLGLFQLVWNVLCFSLFVPNFATLLGSKIRNQSGATGQHTLTFYAN